MSACSSILRLVPVLFLATSTALSGPVSAQDVAGSVQGTIVRASGPPEPEVQVAVSGRNLLGIRTALTDRDGFFQVSALPPGEYTVRIAKIGVRPVVVERVSVQLGRTTAIGPVALEAQPVALEPVVVTAAAATIDPAHTTVGATLDAADYAVLPADRDYKSIIAILPHVNTSYYGDPVNVGGSTGLENMYFIDGVNVTSTLDASTGTSLPYNFVRAVEVKAGGYEAQYGKALGAVVNAVTYTGTNDPNVNGFAFMTHSALAASPKAQPDLREASSLSYDVGLRLSGPVLRDRLWYSAAYNPHSNRVEKEMPGLGLFADRQTAHLFAGKLTWQATPAANLEVSVLGDPTVQHQVAPLLGLPSGLTVVNPDPYLRRLTSGGVTGSLRTTATLGARVLLEGSMAHSSARQSIEPDTPVGGTEPVYVDYVSSTVAGGPPGVSAVTMDRTAVALRSTISLERHTGLVGLEYEDAKLSRTFVSTGQGLIFRLDAGTFLVDSIATRGTFHNRVPTLYLQDSWRVTHRFTLNAGVRWSAQFLTGASGGTAQRFPDEWQPRLGFIWEVGRPGTQRVFGSFGRFYQQEPLSLSSLNYVDYYEKLKTYSADPRQPGAPLVSEVDATTYEKDFARSIDGLKVEHVDEFTLGYERVLGSAVKLTARGIRRELHSAFLVGIAGFDISGKPTLVIGTPGKGNFAFLPSPRREYTALELGVEGDSRRLRYRASYVLSRTWGNYTGLYSSDEAYPSPGANGSFFWPYQAANSTGLLANDRTHVVKLTAAFRAGVGLVAGTFVTWQSGTPLNEFGAGPSGPGAPAFLAPRGSVGRTPAIWDMNLRLTYDTPWPTASRARLVLDVLHVGNPQEVVRLDQIHFQTLDANGVQTNENPRYLGPVAFQPPMTARLGLEMSF